MKIEFIIAIVVLVILIVFVLFVINSLSLEVANKLRRDSEKLFDSYGSVLEKMNQETKDNTSLDKKELTNEVKFESKPVIVLSGNARASYKSDTVFDLYKTINDNFRLDEEELIKKIDKKETNNYRILMKLNKLLTSERVYKISTLSSDVQREVILDILASDDDFKNFIDLVEDDFDIIKFKETIDNECLESNNLVYVFTANKDDLKKSDENTKYIYDSRILVGVQCVKANKLYDYAIERKEVC